MRELSIDEIAAVSGGLGVPVELHGIRMAMRPSNGFGLLVASFVAGYKVGTFIYDTYTSIRY